MIETQQGIISNDVNMSSSKGFIFGFLEDLTKTTKKFEFIFDKKHDEDTTEHHTQ